MFSTQGSSTPPNEPDLAKPGVGGSAVGIVGTVVNFVTRIVGAGPASSEADQLARAGRKLKSNLTIKRTLLTYVVSIDFRSLDANKAAWISNAVTDAYFARELDSKSRAARRATPASRPRPRPEAPLSTGKD